MLPQHNQEPTISTILTYLLGLDEKVSAQMNGMRLTLEVVSSRIESIDDRLAEQGNQAMSTALEVEKVKQEVAIVKERVGAVERSVSSVNKKVATVVAAIAAAIATVIQQAWVHWDDVMKMLRNAIGT